MIHSILLIISIDFHFIINLLLLLHNLDPLLYLYPYNLIISTIMLPLNDFILIDATPMSVLIQSLINTNVFFIFQALILFTNI